MSSEKVKSAKDNEEEEEDYLVKLMKPTGCLELHYEVQVSLFFAWGHRLSIAVVFKLFELNLCNCVSDKRLFIEY
jgi:hypothetical protein